MDVKNLFFKLSFLVFVFCVIYLFYLSSINLTKSIYFANNYQSQIKNCECLNKKEKVEIKNNKEYFFITKGTKAYKISTNVTITCDVYKSLSRGANQSVIAYSLYGTNQRYFRLLNRILNLAKTLYSNYTIRIYHDSSLSSNYTCKFECSHDNVNFCNVEYTPLNKSLESKDHFYNLSYIPPQSWRFIALRDDLINTVLWRDIDSLLIEREVDAVNEWLLSDKFGHIMRDSLSHWSFIMAGMWGLKLSQNRTLARQFFAKLEDKQMAQSFLKKGVQRKKLDQHFLAVHVYKEIRNISMIHDSYLCKVFKDSKPFPSQRTGSCFIGALTTYSFNCFKVKTISVCPQECRPKNHQDWDRC